MRLPVLGLISAALLGCNQMTPPNSTDTSKAPAPTTVTANRPVSPPAVTHASQDDRSNTAINSRDRDRATKTPLDQNENQADVSITADIRKRVVATKMSVNAQNVKIITQDGKVTLRGPVESDDEKRKIEEIAADVAGADHVDSQLEVNRK